MTLLDDAYLAGSQQALSKFAATRAHKEILRSMQSGDMARAHRLSTTPGVMTDSPRARQLGHQLKDIDKGGEGLATMVSHPTHGAVVRKMFDPAGGMYSPTLIKRKEQMKPIPGVANTVGVSQTQHGTPIHFNEFVHGKKITPEMMADPAFAQTFARAKGKTLAAGQAQGRELRDLRPANALATPDGGVKFIDHAPFNRDEVDHPSVERHKRMTGKLPENQVPVAGKGFDLFPNLGDQRPGINQSQLKDYMLGGKPAAGKRWSDHAMLNTALPSQSAVPAPLAPQTPLHPSMPMTMPPTPTGLPNAPTQISNPSIGSPAQGANTVVSRKPRVA